MEDSDLLGRIQAKYRGNNYLSMMEAVKAGNANLVRYFIDKGISPSQKHWQIGGLFAAAESDNPELARLFVDEMRKGRLNMDMIHQLGARKFVEAYLDKNGIEYRFLIPKKNVDVPNERKEGYFGITSSRETDITLLNGLSDEELPKVCKTNKYVHSVCEDPYFWISRIVHVFHLDRKQIEKMKKDHALDSYKALYYHLRQ
jgi:hypothetical protein